MSPDFLGARLVLWWVWVARARTRRRSPTSGGRSSVPGLRTVKKLMLAYACAAAGQREEANGLLWELEPKLASEDRLALLSAFCSRRWTSRTGRSSSCTGRIELREPGLLFLKVAPWLDPLRSDPRYGALVEKLGLG